MYNHAHIQTGISKHMCICNIWICDVYARYAHRTQTHTRTLRIHPCIKLYHDHPLTQPHAHPIATGPLVDRSVVDEYVLSPFQNTDAQIPQTLCKYKIHVYIPPAVEHGDKGLGNVHVFVFFEKIHFFFGCEAECSRRLSVLPCVTVCFSSCSCSCSCSCSRSLSRSLSFSLALSPFTFHLLLSCRWALDTVCKSSGLLEVSIEKCSRTMRLIHEIRTKML